MGLPRLFKKKKKAPENLPDLALEESAEEKKNEEETKKEKPEEKISKEKQDEPEILDIENEKGFFKDLLKNVKKEISDLEELEKWHNHKFVSEDIVSQMRDYWQNQKPEMILKNFGAGLKKDLEEKVEKLHQLEKDWQEIYVNLIEKEQEIKEEEQGLKETLSEFVKLCKQHLSREESKKNPKTKKNK